MKITYEQLYRSYPVLNHLLEERLPLSLTRKFQGFVQSVNPHLQQIEAAQNELIEKYGNETESGYEIPEENRDNFIKELEKYLNYEIVVNWKTISINEFGSDCRISAKGLETISYLIKDYEDVAVIG